MVKKKSEPPQAPPLIPQVLPPVTLKKIPKIVTLLVKVNDLGVIQAVCLNDLKIPENELDAVMTLARGELIKAAHYHVEEEFGRAILALKELFTCNYKIKDYKTALATLKEHNRLLRLYNEDRRHQGPQETPESVELDFIRQLLLPMLIPYGITKREDVPVAEMIRLLLIDYMRLRNETGETRPTSRDHGGKKLPRITQTSRHLPDAAGQGPGKKSRSVKLPKSVE